MFTILFLALNSHLTFALTTLPNKPAKGTLRPLTVLKVRFYQGSVASFKLSERRARNFRLPIQLGM